MSHRVVITRQRIVEEKCVIQADSSDVKDAIAASKHLIDGGVVEWQYNRTIDVTKPEVEISEIKSKKE